MAFKLETRSLFKLLFFILMSYQIILESISYFSYPTMTKLSMKFPSRYPLHAITASTGIVPNQNITQNPNFFDRRLLVQFKRFKRAPLGIKNLTNHFSRCWLLFKQHNLFVSNSPIRVCCTYIL